MNYDFINKLGEKLGLKIEWTQEVLSGQQVETLNSGKIDAICASEGPLNLGTARYLAYTDAIMWAPFFVYVRKDDNRFDGQEDKLNQPDIKFSMIDGDNTDYMTRSKFPEAGRDSLSSSSDPSQLMLDVVTKKADASILDAATVAEFMKNNPDTLQRVKDIDAVGYIPNTLSVLNSETRLLNLLNTGIMGVHAYGDADKIFKKYEEKYKDSPVIFFRPLVPFQTSSTK